MEVLNPPTFSTLPEVQLLAKRTGMPVVYFDHTELFRLEDLHEYHLIMSELPTEQGYVIHSYSTECDSNEVYFLRSLYDEEEPQFYVMEKSIFVDWLTSESSKGHM